MPKCVENTHTTQLDIGMEETNIGIGIPASIISVGCRDQKNAGLHRLGPILDRSQHCQFFLSGTGLIGCRSFRHSGIYTHTNTHAHRQASWTWECSMRMDTRQTWIYTMDMDMQHRHGHTTWTWEQSMNMDMEMDKHNRCRNVDKCLVRHHKFSVHIKKIQLLKRPTLKRFHH